MRVAEHHDAVQPEWLDGNGHMNLAYYVVLFDRGSDSWLDLAGLGGEYRAEGGHTVFAVETHTIYRRELRLGAPVVVRTWLVAADAKRLHLAHEMLSEGIVAALHEVMFVHVSMDSRRVAPMSPAAAARVAALGGEPRPDWLGRQLGIPFPTP
jgi:acyl-CoA thioester hydrolase